jgi:ribosomal protein L32
MGWKSRGNWSVGIEFDKGGNAVYEKCPITNISCPHCGEYQGVMRCGLGEKNKNQRQTFYETTISKMNGCPKDGDTKNK